MIETCSRDGLIRDVARRATSVTTEEQMRSMSTTLNEDFVFWLHALKSTYDRLWHADLLDVFELGEELAALFQPIDQDIGGR